MKRLPSDLHLLDARACGCWESSSCRTLLVAGQAVMMPPWAMRTRLEPRESVRVLVRRSLDGGVELLALKRARETSVRPLGPAIGIELMVVALALCAVGVVSGAHWLLALPALLIIVQLTLMFRRRGAVRWFENAESLRSGCAPAQFVEIAGVSTHEIAVGKCECSQARELHARVRRASRYSHAPALTRRRCVISDGEPNRLGGPQ